MQKENSKNNLLTNLIKKMETMGGNDFNVIFLSDDSKFMRFDALIDEVIKFSKTKLQPSTALSEEFELTLESALSFMEEAHQCFYAWDDFDHTNAEPGEEKALKNDMLSAAARAKNDLLESIELAGKVQKELAQTAAQERS